MEIGAVRVPEDSDYQKIKKMCLGLDESFNTDTAQKTDPNNSPTTNGASTGSVQWRQEYKSDNCEVFIKFDKSVSDLYCVRVKAVYDNVPLATLYDTLLDQQYRKSWDTVMIDSFELCHLAPNTDIGYYSVRCPPPITNRDFVLLRSYLDLRKEIYIVSYSVNHKQLPEKKGLIRGLTYITAYYGVANENGGCTLYYVAQSDPKGKLPSWFVNKASTFFAPRFIKKLQKCCIKYPEWKKKNNPNLKPWLFPEQLKTPRLNPDDVLPIDSLVQKLSINEETAQEDVKATQEIAAAVEKDD